MVEHRRSRRRNFSYYMRVTDSVTQKPVGHLSDISLIGFKLDSSQALPVGVDFNLRFDLSNDIADKNFMSFIARSRWCKADKLDPYIQNVGFEIINMQPQDMTIYQRIVEKYAV